MVIVVLHVRVDAIICAGYFHHRVDVLASPTATEQELEVSEQSVTQFAK